MRGAVRRAAVRPAAVRRVAAVLGVLVVLVALPGCSVLERAVNSGLSASAASAAAASSAAASSASASSAAASTQRPPDAAPSRDPAPCYTAPERTGTIDGTVPEASGLAASSTDPDLFFVIDDAGGASTVVAVRLDGTVVAEIEALGMDPENAEAVVPGACQAGSPARCLYVADIGANPVREEVVVYRMPEPSAADLPDAVPVHEWRYRYPDDGHDAEAMLVTDDGTVLIITKPPKGAAHRIFRGQPGGGALEMIATFRPPGPKQPLQSLLLGNVVTDASRLDDRVLLLMYDQAVEYLAPEPGADPAGFAEWPSRRLEIPRQWQSEGATYLAAAGGDRCGYAVVSERGGVDVAEIGVVRCVT